MRQVIVQVPAEHGRRVLEIAGAHDALNVSRLTARNSDDAATAVVVLHVSNSAVGPLVEALDELPALHVSLLPTGALALRPPAEQVVDQVTDVTARSPLEVYLAGLQSIGSWHGFLGYAVAGAVVVWLGLLTNSVFLLVGAMLIAPFAGPAVNTAIATARGDGTLLWHSLLRYAAALVVTAAVTALLSAVTGQEVATSMMASVASISAVSLLLPLTAGAAGALQLSQGDQSSLVSAAATGMLIAASLAPPAGLIGMAAVSGAWELVPSAIFLLALQLVGINLAGATVFRLFGLAPHGARYTRGRALVRWLSLATSAAGLAALLAWQFASPSPTLERSTVEARLRNAILDTLATDSSFSVVDAELRFTRVSAPNRHRILVVLYVEPRPPVTGDDAALSARVAGQARRTIERDEPNVDPMVAVTVVRR